APSKTKVKADAAGTAAAPRGEAQLRITVCTLVATVVATDSHTYQHQPRGRLEPGILSLSQDYVRVAGP
ncbi:MAG: hypothetical protein R6W91_06840, partial [Thermoplasmata archaeon]